MCLRLQVGSSQHARAPAARLSIILRVCYRHVFRTDITYVYYLANLILDSRSSYACDVFWSQVLRRAGGTRFHCIGISGRRGAGPLLGAMGRVSLDALFGDGAAAKGSSPVPPPPRPTSQREPRKEKVGEKSGQRGEKRKACGHDGRARFMQSEWPVCHSEPDPKCAQCKFARMGGQWSLYYGSHTHTVKQQQARIAWLRERPHRLGGAWGLGCSLCSSLVSRLQNEVPKRRQRKWCTKWSRFECRDSFMQSSTLRQHAATSLHKLAVKAWLCPSEPLVEWLAASPEDDELLRGSVPQLEHWVRAWRYSKSPTSLRAAECIQGTEAFLAGSKAPEAVAVASRRALKSMYEVMAEVVVEKKREWLRSAAAICIMIDDRDAYRICRFRCTVDARDAEPDIGVPMSQPGAGVSASCTSTSTSSVPSKSASSVSSAPSAAAEGQSSEEHSSEHLVDKHTRDGLLFVLRRGGESSSATMETYQGDYSNRMCESIIRGIRKLCTPLGDVCDEQLVTRVLERIYTYVSDGAASAQKCGRLLMQHCKNLVWIQRDPAHAVRTSLESPIQIVDCYASFWEDVFDKRHALVPDVQNSDAWRSKLMAMQHHIIGERGRQGARVESVLRHLSFAKQRFDSCVGPARKFCILLAALTMLLISVACDSRADSKQRQRAQQQLDAMTPCRITAAGLFADYTAASTSFVRFFDADYDIAQVSREKLSFLRRMKILFLEGHVLTAGSAKVAQGLQLDQVGETMTHVAIQQAKEFGTMYYVDRAFCLWPAGAERDAERAVASMSDVVNAMRDRVEAELAMNSFLLQFSAFDLATWRSGVSLLAAGAANRENASQIFDMQIRRVRALAGAHKVIDHAEVAHGLLNFGAIAKFLCKAHRTDIRQRTLDNRAAWAKVLCPGRVPQRWVCNVVRCLVEWYLSVCGLTGGVERNLGRLTKTLEAHQGPLSEDADTIQTLLHLDLDGPRSESDIAASHANAGSMKDQVVVVQDCLGGTVSKALQFTQFSRRCATLWVREHGRRFCVYRHVRTMPKRTEVGNTDAAAVKRQAHAFRSLEQFAESTSGQDSNALTVLGVSRRTLQDRARRLYGTGSDDTKLKKFKKLTTKKKQQVAAECARRRLGLSAYARPELRLGRLFENAPVGDPSVLRRCALNATTTQVAAKVGWTVKDPAGLSAATSKGIWDRVSSVDFVIFRTLADLTAMTPSDTMWKVAFSVIARGKSAISLEGFARNARPDTCTSCVHHQASARLLTCRIGLATAFAEKHRAMRQMFELAAKVDKSQWTVRIVDLGRCSRNDFDHIVTSAADAWHFLYKVRRLARRGGLWRGPRLDVPV